jgi:hypothetical protein
MKRRILRRIKIDEISAVDRPAQVGAVAAIIKSQGGVEMNAFEKRVQEIRVREGCSRIEALRKARHRHRDEFDRYQRELLTTSTPALQKRVNSIAVQSWEDLVERICKRDNISRTKAMAIARRENADIFRAYQEV